MNTKKCCEPNEKIKIKNLSLKYSDKDIFKNLNLSINKGCVSGIIGPSGCGKSSFIQCINRMIEEVPEASLTGEILIDGKSIYDKDIDLNILRRKISLIFQEPTPLPLSIFKNLTLPLKEHGFDNVKDRAEHALKLVGLWEEVSGKLKSSAQNLSGGQKQRLCIARAIALQPEVILMDEPCSSLDPISTDIIEDLIHELKSKYTIMIVTHNLAQARRVCDYVSTFWYNKSLQSGEIIESGTSVEIFENPKNQQVQDYISGLRG